MFIDEFLAMDLNRAVNELYNTIVAEAQKEFIFQRSSGTPGDDLATICNKRRLDRLSGLFIVIAENGCLVSQRLKRSGSGERAVRVSTAAVDDCRTKSGYRLSTVRTAVLVYAANQAHLTSSLADDHQGGEESIRK